MAVMAKLDEFWLRGDCTEKQKINVFNAVLRAKLMYGLDSIQLTQATIRKLDTFQLKGLRKILGLKTTYVNKHNTNERVYQAANTKMEQQSRRGTPPRGKKVIKLSQYYEMTKAKLFARMILMNIGDERAAVAFNQTTFTPHDHGKKE